MSALGKKKSSKVNKWSSEEDNDLVLVNLSSNNSNKSK